jgi:anti-sigma regulatory factor (Ser/Thr protein kinase)
MSETQVQLDRPYRHEAMLYAGLDEFVPGAATFLREGVEAGEPALVVVSAPKIELLRDALGGQTEGVMFADMTDVGLNPARIIPAWRDFAAAHGRRAIRGIGEPIWAERSPVELVECQRHESLLNVAFEGLAALWLLCPYDTTALPAEVVDEARRSHPFVARGEVRESSGHYRGTDAGAAPFEVALLEPTSVSGEAAFDAASLAAVRAQVARLAARAGLGPSRVADFTMAVNEVATNSVIHGGGQGTLRTWLDHDAVVAEVRDSGVIADPLAGRHRPDNGIDAGRGLWLANALCDLVQVRALSPGTVVRLHMRRP